MARIERRIKRLFESPHNISDKELIRIMIALGFEHRKAKGSHTCLKHPLLPHVLITIPNQNPLKVGYIVEIRKIVAELMELQNEE